MSGIDEMNCDVKCKSGKVQCSDGKCAVVGDGNTECKDGSDEDCPECPECPDQCEAGEVLCKHKTSGKMECVSTCDDAIECALHEDKKALPTCPVVCPLASIKCKLRNGRGLGCAPVCDKIQQCQDFDESLGIVKTQLRIGRSVDGATPPPPGPTPPPPGPTPPPSPPFSDLCDVLAAGCDSVMSQVFCFIQKGTLNRTCCGCETMGNPGAPFFGILAVFGVCQQDA